MAEKIKKVTKILMRETDRLLKMIVRMNVNIAPRHRQDVLGKDEKNIKLIVQETKKSIVAFDELSPKFNDTQITILGSTDAVDHVTFHTKYLESEVFKKIYGIGKASKKKSKSAT